MRRLLSARQPLLNQRGDTIVEVMVAVLVIGAVLVGAFALTNRSTRGVRDSEEHAQALQLLQGQVERLRSTASTTEYDDFPPSGRFCFNTDGDIESLSSGDYGCQSGDFYTFAIERGSRPSAGATTTFTLQTKWDSVTGNTATERIVYKVNLLQ